MISWSSAVILSSTAPSEDLRCSEPIRIPHRCRPDAQQLCAVPIKGRAWCSLPQATPTACQLSPGSCGAQEGKPGFKRCIVYSSSTRYLYVPCMGGPMTLKNSLATLMFPWPD